MNAVAVIVGSIYGLLTVASTYLVSMVASGLFARAFYRIYARVLIGICSIMMLAPLVQWISPHPVSAILLLTLAGWLATGILAYGVARFNREFMKTVFLDRRLTAYFTFGTLANATVITLVLLHISASSGRFAPTVIGPGHYGPFLMLLAAMVFHTDYHLKLATGSARQFSRFTFVGYAVALVAILISVLPYVGQALAELKLAPAQQAFLENFSCVQTLLLAILVFGGLAWQLGSIPPVYLFLLAICAEYYVLVAQWFIWGWGSRDGLGWPALGLVSMPLLIGIAVFSEVLTKLDRKREERRLRLNAGAEATHAAEALPHFVTPFQVVNWSLAAVLAAVTIWTRLDPHVSGSPLWLATTFVTMAICAFVATVALKSPAYLYAAGLLAGLAAILGFEPVVSPWSALTLATLALAWGVLSWVGEVISLKREFRIALTDAGLVSALTALVVVACRHVATVGGAGPYNFNAVVSVQDLVALVFTAATMPLAARQYRSRLPIYGAVVAAILVNPMLSAGIGFLACMCGELIRRFGKEKNVRTEEAPLPLFNRVTLPLQDHGPELYARPLVEGALPLALLGLALSAKHIIHNDLSNSAILGMAVSALVLGLLTHALRWVWLYALSLACAYVTIHAAACRWHWIDTPTTPAGISRHLLLMTGIAITGWVIASAYSTWCNFWLRRVAEEKEDAIRKKQAFYGGVLHATTLAAAVAATIGLATLIRYHYPATVTMPLVPTAAAMGLALLFGLLAATYHSAGPSYFCIVAICLASYSAVGLLPADGRGTYDGLALATIALVLGLLRNGVYAIWPAAADQHSEEHALASPRSYQAERAVWMQQLWAVPLHHASILLPFAAIAHVLVSWNQLNQVWALSALYVSAAVWLLATGSHRDEILRAFTPGIGGTSLARQTAMIGQVAQGERVVLMLLSIVTAYFAIHATVQSYLFAPSIVDGGQIIAWHTVVAGLTSMVGWGVATSYAAWCGVCLRGKSEDDATFIRQRLFFYGGLLYHLTAVAAIIDLGVLLCVSMGQNLECARVYFVACLIVAIYFCLAGAVYRSKLGTYLSLLAVSLMALNFFSVVPVWRFRSAADGAALAVLGLLAAIIARVLRIPSETDSGNAWDKAVPVPWSQSPLPFTEMSWRPRWAIPLAEFSLLLSLGGVLLVFARWNLAETPAALVTLLATSGVCLLAAMLYRTPLLTYLGVVALWAAVYVGLMPSGLQLNNSGPAVAGLALLVWGAGFAVERLGRNRQLKASGANVAVATSLDIHTVFEKPLLKCAVVMALAAIVHGLVVYGHSGMLQPLLAASVLAAMTLLLTARNVQGLDRITEARTLVYIGCLAASVGALAATSIVWNRDALAPTAAAMSVVLAVIGLALMEGASAAERRNSEAERTLRLYGEPIARFSLVFPAAAISLGAIGSISDAQAAPFGMQLTIALLAAGLAYFISVRSLRDSFWLSPSIVLTSLGISTWIQTVFDFNASGCLLANILLMHLWVCGARWIRHSQDRFGALLGVDVVGCDRAFYWWPFFATAVILVGATLYSLIGSVTPVLGMIPDWRWRLTPLLAFLLFFHILYLERHRFFVHALIGSGLLATLWLAGSSDWRLTPDLALLGNGLFWAAVAAMLSRPIGARMLRSVGIVAETAELRELAIVAIHWFFGLLVLAVVVTVPTWAWKHPAYPSTSLTLLLAAGACIWASYQGRRELSWYSPATSVMKPFRTLRDSQGHVALDVVGAVLILPGIWATLAFLQDASSGMSARTFATMLPIAGLATAVLALIYTAVSRQQTKKFPNDDSGLRRLGTGPALLQVAAAFTLIACGLTALAVTMTTPTIPVAASLVVLSVAWLLLAWLRQEELWVYLAGCGLAAIYLYVRHGLYGAPFGPDFGKAFGVIGICFLFFGFNIAVSRNTIARLAVFRRPTFYSALFLPFVLLKVTPHEPTWTVSLAFFAVAAFYAFVARRERLQWTAYLSAILFNIAVYLWVPELSRSGHLLQLYVIPAAITVLVLAQLHRRDLSRQTLTGVRYAAAGAILAVSSLDAFSSANLTHFVLVLFLSLAGIVVGVALRIRPFVFVGLAFLVVNVLGQLGLQFQQHAALRAAILIGVGFVVIGIMVFLNIRREEILRKYRSFAADSRWE